jgi:hypothetical protein
MEAEALRLLILGGFAMRTGIYAIVACWALLLAGLHGQQPAPASSPGALDYEFFKSRVQPIFLAKRPGHARCIACHGQGTPLRLQPAPAGAAGWNEEDSKKNFAAVSRVAQPGNAQSRLLIHPLDERAGGDFYHNGGKHWSSQNDAEWQVLRTWVMGAAK